MDAILDKFGRVVIPKKIRETLGIGPGSVFHIEAENREIHLKPVEENTGLKKNKNGWLVFTGDFTASPEDAVDQIRRKRLRHISGFEK